MRAQNQSAYVLFSHRIYVRFFALIPPTMILLLAFLKRKTQDPVRSGLILNYLFTLNTDFTMFIRELTFLDREMVCRFKYNPSSRIHPDTFCDVNRIR